MLRAATLPTQWMGKFGNAFWFVYFYQWSTRVSALKDTLLYGLLPPRRTGLQEMQPPSKPSELPHRFRLFRLLWKETQTFLPRGDSNSCPPRRKPQLNDLRYGLMLTFYSRTGSRFCYPLLVRSYFFQISRFRMRLMTNKNFWTYLLCLFFG